VVCDAAEGIGKPSLWIDTVELCGLNQGIDDGCGFAPTLGPHEHAVFATNGDGAHGPFGCVVVELKGPVSQISAQALNAGEWVIPPKLRGCGNRIFSASYLRRF
jgi:hypothetical protein